MFIAQNDKNVKLSRIPAAVSIKKRCSSFFVFFVINVSSFPDDYQKKYLLPDFQCGIGSIPVRKLSDSSADIDLFQCGN
jgi:hypothetical protein